MVWRNN
jgi:putative oxidoreductase